MGEFIFRWGKKKNLTPEESARNRSYLRAIYDWFGKGVTIQSDQNLQHYINKGYEANNDVFSVVNWISEQAANIPLQVQQKRGDEWVNVDEHPLQKLINRPNPYQSGIEQRQLLYTFYLITGNGLRYAPRIEAGPNEGQALEMWVLPSQYTEIVSGGYMNPIEGYNVTWSAGKRDMFTFNDVMHIRTPNLDFGSGQELWGMSPLRAGLLSLNRSNNNQVAANSSFENLGAAGIIKETVNDMMPEFSDDLKSEKEGIWIDQYNGARNKGKMYFTNRDVDYVNIGLSPVDMNLILDKQATKRDFCSIYKVSSVLFNDNENSTYNNVLEAKKSAYNDAVVPLVEREAMELNDWIAESYGSDLRVIADTSDVAVLQQDRKVLMEWIEKGVTNGIITRNEGREVLNLGSIEDTTADQLTVTFSTMPLSDIDADPMAASGDDPNVKHYLDNGTNK